MEEMLQYLIYFSLSSSIYSGYVKVHLSFHLLSQNQNAFTLLTLRKMLEKKNKVLHFVFFPPSTATANSEGGTYKTILHYKRCNSLNGTGQERREALIVFMQMLIEFYLLLDGTSLCTEQHGIRIS